MNQSYFGAQVIYIKVTWNRYYYNIIILYVQSNWIKPVHIMEKLSTAILAVYIEEEKSISISTLKINVLAFQCM